ncbi:MAG: hypothetical protein HQK78_17075 [Desulfobacterales bacterium]|nr:hypothetical protein [Desulfobacterales bacterium]
MDSFLNRQRERNDLTPELCSGLVNTIGAFLGECIIAEYGGVWEHTDDGWCVSFDQTNRAFPFTKVRKQLENGPDDSIYSFFTVIPMFFKDVVKKGKEIKPWWKIW